MAGASHGNRLFVGVPIPAAAAAKLEAHLARHAAGVGGLPGRLVPAANWHVTLAFLGDVPQEGAAKVREALAAADLGAAFAARIGGLGAFPNTARARVLWIGFSKGRGAFAELADRVAAATLPFVIADSDAPASRPKTFSAHLTLSRLRTAINVAAVVTAVPPLEEVVGVTEVVLFRSVLGAGAPTYERVATYPLGGAPGGSGSW